MRIVLTLAVLACVVAPADAQRYRGRARNYYQPAYQSGVVVSTHGTYVNAQPRVAYSYSPATYPTYSTVTYSQPSYNPPMYGTTQTYSTPIYSQPSVVYSQPSSSMSMTYSTPLYSSGYSQPIVSSQPIVFSQPFYSTPVQTYSQPSVVYSSPTTYYSTQPGYYSTPITSSPSYPTYTASNYGWSQPLQSTRTYQPGFSTYSTVQPTQPNWNFVPPATSIAV